jgi:uncharacterized membrane protein YkvA (DUF1232 family)
MLSRLKRWARHLRTELIVLWFCCRHPATPLPAKIVAIAVVAYAFSPFELIPDFIPVLGYLDDLVLVPAGIWLALRLVPAPVLAECRTQAHNWVAAWRLKTAGRIAAAAILVFWLIVAWLVWRFWLRDLWQ